MHKTVYIDVEEEIIGIIRKIRNAEGEEIFLVVPKNSLLTQGIVNLKLLKKEVVKMGKEVILVTSDEHSRKIIEKIGLKTRNKSVQDFVGDEEENSQDNLAKRKIKSEKLSFETTPQQVKKRNIGSSSFYHHSDEDESEEEENLNQEDLNSDFKAKVNSVQSDNQKEIRKIRVNEENTFGEEHIRNQEFKNEMRENEIKESARSNQINKSKTVEGFKFINPTKNKKEEESHSEMIDSFYRSHLKNKPKSREDLKQEQTKNHKSSFQVSNKKKFAFFVVVIFLFFLSGLGFWAYSNWPKMEVQLFPKEKIEETTFDLLVCDEKKAGEDCLKGDYQELTVKVSDNYDSSGEKFSNDKGMARGIVKIYNNYSSSPQALVATTRLMSEEGKLFRLIKGVTVPGMDGDKPGVVEAQVIANKIGQDYNIKPTEFKISGFKGGDKYDKFKVVSENSMMGGANDTDNKKVKVVTEKDISSAREKTIDSFNQRLEADIKKQIDPSETLVFSSIEKEIIKSDSSYAPGDIIDKFNYTIEQRIKLITFNENDFNDIIKKSFGDKVSENLVFSEIQKIDFQKDIANYQDKTLDLAIKAKGVYWPIINNEEIKNQLAVKKGEEIKEYLMDLEQIERAIVTYSPSWLGFITVKTHNISVEEVK